LKNILIGEVWLASGQSNMEMPLNGFWNNPIFKANETIAMAGQNKGMRFVTIPKTAAMTPQETVKGTWKECNSENAPWFSATAYHFAQMLYRTLNVPVGIIVSSWGGTRVEGWFNREILESYPDIDLSEKAINELNPMARPMLMYNAMIHPLIHYTIKDLSGIKVNQMWGNMMYMPSDLPTWSICGEKIGDWAICLFITSK
jgi:sialate O-acetylesterase